MQAEGAADKPRRRSQPRAVGEKQQDRKPPGLTFLDNLRAGFEKFAQEISSGVEQDLKAGAGRELSDGASRGTTANYSGASDEDAAVAEILSPSSAASSYRQIPRAPGPGLRTPH